MTGKRCSICGTESASDYPSVGRAFRSILRPSSQFTSEGLSHIESVHPEYAAWFLRWVRTLLIAAIVAIPILVFGDYTAIQIHNDTLLFIVTVSYIVFMQAIIWRVPLKLRQVKRQWRQEHGMT